MEKIKYLLSLDLSSSQSGYAIFKLDSNELLQSGAVKKKGKRGMAEYCDDMYSNESYLTKGVFLRDLMIKELAREIDSYGYELSGENTILVIEKRLSAFSKFSTNQTIEAIAQLSQSALLLFAGEKKMKAYHVPVLSWQNKLFGPKKDRGTTTTKDLSLKYIKDNYGIESASDDEADAICIGEYYLNNCIYNNLSKENAKELLYKNLVSTQKEIFNVTYPLSDGKMKTEKMSINEFKLNAELEKNKVFTIDGKENKVKMLFYVK